MAKVFIDGNAGTTGLRIEARLQQREDLELLTLAPEERKNPQAKAEIMSEADVVILCVPDAVACQTDELVAQLDHQPVIIDASTAHRTNTEWVYGLPELLGNSERIAQAQKIANPGCHATGFIALIAPLISTGVIDANTLLSCTSITGYSGGGKAMIAQYESKAEICDGSPDLLAAPRMYGLTQTHKHLREMQMISCLQTPPIFIPIVANYYSGMEVIVPLQQSQLKAAMSVAELLEVYRDYYATAPESAIYVHAAADEDGFLSAARFADRDDLEISVYGNDARMVLVARFDNLGKGACGAAIQNLNLALKIPALTGLNIAGETK